MSALRLASSRLFSSTFSFFSSMSCTMLLRSCESSVNSVRCARKKARRVLLAAAAGSRGRPPGLSSVLAPLIPPPPPARTLFVLACARRALTRPPEGVDRDADADEEEDASCNASLREPPPLSPALSSSEPPVGPAESSAPSSSRAAAAAASPPSHCLGSSDSTRGWSACLKLELSASMASRCGVCSDAGDLRMSFVRTSSQSWRLSRRA
jgi:hypothetical protein